MREKNFFNRADWDILRVRFDYIEYSWDSKGIRTCMIVKLSYEDACVNTRDKINYKW